MHVSEIFTIDNIMLVGPVVGAGLILMPLLFSGLSNALMPSNEIDQTSQYARAWAHKERERILARRNEERREQARQAWMRGDPNAAQMIGKRRSDYEALGIPYPGDNA